MQRTTLVERVVADVVRWLRAERVAAGTRLPSVRDMAHTRQVSADTIARAYDRLVALGYIEARRGSGFYVRVAAAPPARPTRVDGQWAHTRIDWRTRLLGSELPTDRHLGGSRLPEGWMDRESLDRALRRFGRHATVDLLGCGEVAGLLPLREHIARGLSDDGIEAAPSAVVTTCGATHALDLVLNAFSYPAQSVLVEDPGPFALQERLAAWNMNLLPVTRHADGPDLSEIEQHCRQHRPALFFFSSRLHNPTSSQVSPRKASALVQLARDYQFMVVDDDSYGELGPSPGTQPGADRVARVDGLQHTIQLGSFSTTLGAGLRVGYVAASEAHAERITLYKSALGLATSVLPEHLALRLLGDGSYRHRCSQIRANLDLRRRRSLTLLRKHGYIVAAPPNAGMFVWVRHPDVPDAVAYAARALRHDLLLAPGVLFSVVDRWRDHMRFNVATACREVDFELLATLR